MKSKFLFAVLFTLISTKVFAQTCESLFFARPILAGEELINKIATNKRLLQIVRQSSVNVIIDSPSVEETARIRKVLIDQFGLNQSGPWFDDRHARSADGSIELYAQFDRPTRTKLDIRNSPDVLTILKTVSDTDLLGTSSFQVDEDSISTYANRRGERLHPSRNPTIVETRNETLGGHKTPVDYLVLKEGLQREIFYSAAQTALHAERLDQGVFAQRYSSRERISKVEISVLKKGSVFSPSDERLFYMSDITFKVNIYYQSLQSEYDGNIMFAVRVLRRPIDGSYRVESVTPINGNEID